MTKTPKPDSASLREQIKARVAALAARPAAGGGPMTTDKFWAIVARTNPEAGFDAQAQRLTDLLSALPIEQVQQFERTFNQYKRKADDHGELRGVALELGGGAGDDGWMDFMSWLISRGRDVYRAALRDPESLRPVAAESEAVDFEEFQYVAGRILDEA